jgi:hypothetical protein
MHATPLTRRQAPTSETRRDFDNVFMDRSEREERSIYFRLS